jgi:uncharacterized protein (TIGR02145 family)
MKNLYWQGILALLLLVIACNSEQLIDDNGMLTPVKIRTVQIGGAKEETVTRASVPQQQIVQPISLDLGDGALAVIAIEEEISALRADPEPQPLKGGVKFRIIALEAGSLYGYADYTMPESAGGGSIVPDNGDRLECVIGQTYDFICYSYNSSASLPALSAENPLVLPVDNSKDLLYWWEPGNTIEAGEALAINMTHQFVKVKLKVDGKGKTITTVSGLISLNAASSGSFNLKERKLSASSGSVGFTGWPSPLNANTAESGEITFLPKATDYTLTIPAKTFILDGTELPSKTRYAYISAEKFEKGRSYTLAVTLKALTASDKFASSNIYWDGTKLTFAPYSEDPATDYPDERYYQGVYFQWGSLVGISPVGNYTTQNTVHYRPVIADRTWEKVTVGTAWSTIPSYFGEVFSSEISGKAAYSLTVKEDFAKYKGDICNYINSSYRMPTMSELENFAGSYIKFTASDVTNIDASDDAKAGKYLFNSNNYATIGGLVFPASGYRLTDYGTSENVGKSGRYWSGSSYDNDKNAFNLHFKGGENSATTSNASRRYGGSVRCVMN